MGTALDLPSGTGAGVLRALVAGIVEARRTAAIAQARESRLLSAAVDLVLARTAELPAATRSRASDLPLRDVCAELGAAMRASDRTVQARMGTATTLERFPATRAAWERGDIDAAHVSAILDAGAALGDAAIERFEDAVLPLAHVESPARVRAAARALAAQVDPEAEAARCRDAALSRSVRVIDLDDGMARLLADLPAVLAYAIRDRLTAIARASHDADSAAAAAAGQAAHESPDAAGPFAPTESSGDCPTSTSAPRLTDLTAPALRSPAPTSLDHRRADLLAELLLTGAPTADAHRLGAASGAVCADPTDRATALGAIAGRVQVTVPLTALLGGSESGGGSPLLAGYGPIDPTTARQLAIAAPGWDLVFTDPRSGLPLAVERYRPSKKLRRFLAARDEHCRFPGCRVPAARCDVDHTVDAARGGPTADANLAHLCRRHHTLKHATAWTLRQRVDGVLEWTSPLGRSYLDRAPSTVRFLPSPPAQHPVTRAESPHAAARAESPPPF